MDSLAPVTIQVSRDEVVRCDCTRSTAVLRSFVPGLLARNRNRVQVEVLGYSADSRELFDVPEVRRFFETWVAQNPGFFYWIDISSYMLLFLGLMLYEPWRSQGVVGLKPEDMQAYLIRGFAGLNDFCAETGASPDETNAAIKEWLHGDPG